MAAPIYRQSVFARQACFLLLAAFLALLAPVSHAGDLAIYTVEGVEVDVTAENAVKAREKAVDEAQSKAYHVLLGRLVGEDAAQTIAAPDPVSLSVFVQDFEVTKEQLSTKRYKGTYTVRFRPAQVQNRLAGLGVSPAAAPRKSVLVLPFYQVGGQTVLWSDTNPWMAAWRSFSSGSSVVLPIGDAQDIAQVNDADGLRYDPLEVQDLAARYGADDVAVLLASPEPSGTQGRLAVNIYNNGFNGPSFVQKIVVDQHAGEDTTTFFQRSAGQVRSILATGPKTGAVYTQAAPASVPAPVVQPHMAPSAPYYPQQQTAPVPYTRPALGASKTYAARARFASVQDWVRMKNTLDRVYGMQAVMIKSLKSREAILDIRYAGDIPSLQIALQNAGIMMRGAPDGALELHTGTGMTPVYR